MPNNDFVAPHFRMPFEFGADGHAVCVEQDSPEDVEQCVYAVVLTTKGQRIELPDYGVPDQVFSEDGPDTEEYARAIEEWEDRAALVIDLSQDVEVDTLAWNVHVGVEERDDRS